MFLGLVLPFAFTAGCDDLDEVRGAHQTLHAHEEHEEHEEHELHHAHAIHRSVSPEEAARVQLIESEKTGREMEAMGVVDAHEKPGHHEEALQELREEAAALGAEAVIGVEFHHGEGHGEVSHLSGLAVRFRNLLRDEPYDVIADLDVAMEMEDQDRALRELRHRAAVYSPDLIIGIHYEHGEGGAGEKIHLKGKAIRYRSSGSSATGMP
jgi:uncharacterized protein YbjQ (UPF0145 family)